MRSLYSVSQYAVWSNDCPRAPQNEHHSIQSLLSVAESKTLYHSVYNHAYTASFTLCGQNSRGKYNNVLPFCTISRNCNGAFCWNTSSRKTMFILNCQWHCWSPNVISLAKCATNAGMWFLEINHILVIRKLYFIPSEIINSIEYEMYISHSYVTYIRTLNFGNPVWLTSSDNPKSCA